MAITAIALAKENTMQSCELPGYLPDPGAVLAKLDRPVSVLLNLSPLAAFVVVTHLQLALRRPPHQGPYGAKAREIALELQKILAEIDPELGQLVELGWYALIEEPFRQP
jgi:hypothetical protein